MFRNPTTDLIVVLVIVLLIFGPKRLPGMGRQLGQGLREFKDSITGDSEKDDGGQRPRSRRLARRRPRRPVAPPRTGRRSRRRPSRRASPSSAAPSSPEEAAGWRRSCARSGTKTA